MPDFSHRGVRLNYEVQGTGVAFIFLHGMGGSIGQIQKAYIPLDGVMMVSLDQQGHGESGVCWETYTFDTLADDVIALADHLGIPAFALGGISMGAAVSLNAALRYPARVLGLIPVRSAWTDRPMDEGLRHLFKLCSNYLEKGDREGFLGTQEYQRLALESAYTANSFAANFDNKASLQYFRKFAILPSLAPFQDVEQLSAIRVPARVLANGRDRVHPLEYGLLLAEHIPGAKFKEITDKDTDADAHREQMNACIRAFLREVYPGAGL